MEKFKSRNMIIKSSVVVFLICLVVGLLRYRKWVQSFVTLHTIPLENHIKYVPKKGDIICRTIPDFKPKVVTKIFKHFLHFGLVTDNEMVYHFHPKRRTSYTHINDFVNKDNMEIEFIYLVKFPDHYYRSINESIKMFKKWKQEEEETGTSSYKLLKDNCESRVILARVKDEYQPHGSSFQVEWTMRFRPFKPFDKINSLFPFKLVRYNWDNKHVY